MSNQESSPSYTWPMPVFTFKVKILETTLTFQEVTGLSTESQLIEYRQNGSQIPSMVKMPGLKKFGQVMLKKGFGDASVLSWLQQVKMNTFPRLPVTISLMDESGQETMSWTLINAFLTKVSVAEQRSGNAQIVIDLMELVHEGLSTNLN